jgi:hypothetical protein
LVDANTIDYEVTIEDPTIYTRPWKMTFPKRRAGSDGVSPASAADNDPYANERWEAACHEGNHEHLTGLAKLGFQCDPAEVTWSVWLRRLAIAA